MSSSLHDECLQKLRVLDEHVWEGKVKKQHIDAWLANFSDDERSHSQREHALYLLTHFMYFGSREIRALLVAMFRDKFKYPVVKQIRERNAHSRDLDLLAQGFQEELLRTRFLGVGNPSESGQHLLYYFRQENNLPKDLFINTHEVFEAGSHDAAARLRDASLKRLVFIDDFCGSGDQAAQYSEDVVSSVKRLDPTLEVCYFAVFATQIGLDSVRRETLFDRVECVVSLDNSYRVFDTESRYFATPPSGIDATFALEFLKRYGEKLCPSHPLGYRNGQLLLGFLHNVPDNSLPVFWSNGTDGTPWTPIFKRFPKIG